MADFLKAYTKTLGNEGEYSNDPVDVGGETYKGISRRYNPSWVGWEKIDTHKAISSNFPSVLKDNVDLQNDVRDFYKAKYWDVNLLDNFNTQLIAEELFDTGVNMGVGRAAEFLQKALNYLNKNGVLYADLVVDGVIGNNTLKSLNACISYRGESFVYKIMNILQGNHYLEFMSKSPIQEKFAYGWLDRVEFLKK